MISTEIPLCACGCGKPVTISAKTDTKRGLKKGDPNKFATGHHIQGPGYWTGKKMPEEARKHMSESARKKVLTEEHKRKLSESHKGRIVSEETIKKFIGKKQSFETKMKKRESQLGDKGTGWKGGIASQKNIEKHSLFFKEWRRSVLDRDNHTCRKCGATKANNNEAHIQTHHIKPYAKYPELRHDVNNGITLCEKCHKEEHKRLGQLEKALN